ncbi:MAG: hypothetical protein OXD46_00110 [Chloroflexi bacterium]|nr:hypothetical protein [Chloroflexota bacterium]
MDSNTTIAEHGQFWLSENEDKKLRGTLYINEVNEATLETLGSLIEPNEGGSHTILGQVGSKQDWVTLIDCFPTKTETLLGGAQTDWSHQTCVVNLVLIGICFERGEEIAFERASITISTLPKWAVPKLVRREFGNGKARPNRGNILIEDRADETATVNLRREKIKISIVFRPKEKWEHRGAITRYQVEDNCYLTIERSDGSKMTLESISSIVRAMQDLLSICCNETSIVASFSVYHEQGERNPVKVYVRMWGNDVERKQGRPYAALSLNDLGGMEGVARWIEVRERYGAAAALLTSNWYNEKAYNEDKFSRMYTAVEGMVARKQQCDTAQMKVSKLAAFVEEAIPGFSSIVDQNPREWAKEAKGIRDKQVSHLDPINTVVLDGRKLRLMTNILYIAGASFLLREIGVSENQVEGYIEDCSKSVQLS